MSGVARPLIAPDRRTNVADDDLPRADDACRHLRKLTRDEYGTILVIPREPMHIRLSPGGPGCPEHAIPVLTRNPSTTSTPRRSPTPGGGEAPARTNATTCATS